MIIGISGHMRSGKDEVGKMIQFLTSSYYPEFTYNQFKEENKSDIVDSRFEIKKFADKLKDIVCLLIGCTREQLEGRTFKEKELGEEWWYYKYGESLYNYSTEKTLLIRVMNSEFLEPCTEEDLENCLVKPTPRLLLQLIGTECGREILHPNLWVNSLFADYKNEYEWNVKIQRENSSKIDEFLHKPKVEEGYPNWIITDMRFPNEAKAVKDRNGILIRVNRPIQMLFNGDRVITNENKKMKVITSDNEIKRCKLSDGNHYKFSELRLDDKHPSETALDQYQDWDYVIDNNGTIENLVKKVKEILIKEKII